MVRCGFKIGRKITARILKRLHTCHKIVNYSKFNNQYDSNWGNLYEM